MHRGTGQASFADAFVTGGGNARLERISSLIDWGSVEAVLSGVYNSATGRPAYPPLLLLKVLLLESWYGLSDPMMEEALGDRLSFRRFVGLGLDERVPDHSTISRFRSLLAERGLAERVFGEVARQIEGKGLIVKQGTLIDATLVQAAAAEPPKQKGGGVSKVDPDAAWMKHGRDRAWFGYKLHVAVDQGSNLIRKAVLTPANVQEVSLGPDLVMGDEWAVYADKGYSAARMRARLRQGAIKDRVQQRAHWRRPPLRRLEVKRNILIGRIRGRIEGVFGTLKRSYGLDRMRFMGLARNTAATLLTLPAWNLARAADRTA